MDKEVLLHQAVERFKEHAGRAIDVLEEAPDGQWIAASEEAFRDAAMEALREVFQAALQARIDEQSAAGEAAFPPSADRDG